MKKVLLSLFVAIAVAIPSTAATTYNPASKVQEVGEKLLTKSGIPATNVKFMVVSDTPNNSEFISTSHLVKQDKYGNIVKDEKNEVVIDNKGRFQLDHFWPKSKHPFLSISFFNLQPSCNFCNLWKSDDDIPFNLFTNESNVSSPFNFFLSEEDAINYAKTHQMECLKIHFKTTVKNYDVFHIEEVYEPFKYEVEEMFWKKVSNGVSYLDMLKKSLPNDLMVDNDFLHRFLYGYYRDPRDILKRPLTKMKQDIAIQLEKLAPKIKV